MLHDVTVRSRRKVRVTRGHLDVIDCLKPYKGGGAKLAANLLRNNSMLEPMTAAMAREFGLDPEIPSDREALLRLLVAAVTVHCFDKGAPKGPRFWTQFRLLCLKVEYAGVTRDCPGITASDAAQVIWDKYPEYKRLGITVETIRQRLPRARTRERL